MFIFRYDKAGAVGNAFNINVKWQTQTHTQNGETQNVCITFAITVSRYTFVVKRGIVPVTLVYLDAWIGSIEPSVLLPPADG